MTPLGAFALGVTAAGLLAWRTAIEFDHRRMWPEAKRMETIARCCAALLAVLVVFAWAAWAIGWTHVELAVWLGKATLVAIAWVMAVSLAVVAGRELRRITKRQGGAA